MTDPDHTSGVVPAHLGLILDGNRRWARQQGLPVVDGHRRGYANLRTIALAAADRGVEYISAFVFSTKNWERTTEEIDYLMDLIMWVATKDIDVLARDGFKILFLGSLTKLNPKVLQAIDLAERKTQDKTRAVLSLCLNYGGEVEIAEGVARMLADAVAPEAVTPDLIKQYLYHPEIPPLDLVIRTAGEQRLSGFMLWRVSYSELYFSPKLWPVFSKSDLDKALKEYASRKRRFGK